MYEEFINFTQERIQYLREQKSNSARDMSLELGLNDTYINKIENKKSVPSLKVFFYICEFLKITPFEFFDEGNQYPEQLREIMSNLKKLDEKTLESLSIIVKKMV